jgi:hypothetical protein
MTVEHTPWRSSFQAIPSHYGSPLVLVLGHTLQLILSRESDLENGDGRIVAIGRALCGSKVLSVLQSKLRRAPSTLHGRDRLCWFLIIVWIIIAAPDICTFSYISEVQSSLQTIYLTSSRS